MTVKKVLINGIIFVVGAIAGGAGTYFWCKKGEEDRINAEVKSVKETYEKAFKKPNTSDSKKDEQDIRHGLKQAKNGLKTHSGGSEQVAIRQTAEEIKQANNYGGYFENQKPPMVDFKVALLNDIVESSCPSERDNEPYVLTEDMLADEDGAGDMTFCTLYTQDQVLSEDTTNEALDVASTIGENIFNKFLNALDTDEIYVKDPRTDIVYDIVRENSSYAEMMEAFHGGV